MSVVKCPRAACALPEPSWRTETWMPTSRVQSRSPEGRAAALKMDTVRQKTPRTPVAEEAAAGAVAAGAAGAAPVAAAVAVAGVTGVATGAMADPCSGKFIQYKHACTDVPSAAIVVAMLLSTNSAQRNKTDQRSA